MPECLGHKLFINEEKKPSSMWETCLWARDVDFLKSGRKNKIKLFVIAKSAYYAFWAAVQLPKCSSMTTSVVHGHIQPSLLVRSSNEEKKIMDRRNGWKEVKMDRKMDEKKSRWTEKWMERTRYGQTSVVCVSIIFFHLQKL